MSAVCYLAFYIDDNLTYDEHIIKTASAKYTASSMLLTNVHSWWLLTLQFLANYFIVLMYGRIHRSVILTNCRLCKTSLAALWAAHANMMPISKELNCLSVASQLYYGSATMAFKCMMGNAPEYLSSKFLKRAEVSGHNTRNSQLLNIPF